MGDEELPRDVAWAHLRLGIEVTEIAAKLNSSAVINQQSCTITKKAPTMAFSWLKAPTSAFTFKTLLRHTAKQVPTHGR